MLILASRRRCARSEEENGTKEEDGGIMIRIGPKLATTAITVSRGTIFTNEDSTRKAKNKRKIALSHGASHGPADPTDLERPAVVRFPKTATSFLEH